MMASSSTNAADQPGSEVPADICQLNHIETPVVHGNRRSQMPEWPVLSVRLVHFAS